MKWAVIVFAFASTASAQVPNITTWAGTLTDDGGAPLDGDHDFDFELFATFTGGSALDAFSQTVDVVDGELVVDLAFDPALFDGGERFMEITIEGETLTPRVRLSTQAYAFRAGAVSWDDIEDKPAGFDDDVDDVSAGGGGVTAGTGITVTGTVVALATGGVTTTQIADGTIIAADLGAQCVDTAELADDAVTNPKIANGAVDTAELANGAVTSAKILDGDVGGPDIADNAINSAKLTDNAVTTAELADNAVGLAELANNAVGTAELVNGAVTRDKIAGTGVAVRLVENPRCVNVGSLTTQTSCRAAFCGVSSGNARFFRCDQNNCDQNTQATNCGLAANNGQGAIVGVLVPP